METSSLHAWVFSSGWFHLALHPLLPFPSLPMSASSLGFKDACKVPRVLWVCSWKAEPQTRFPLRFSNSTCLWFCPLSRLACEGIWTSQESLVISSPLAVWRAQSQEPMRSSGWAHDGNCTLPWNLAFFSLKYGLGGKNLLTHFTTLRFFDLVNLGSLEHQEKQRLPWRTDYDSSPAALPHLQSPVCPHPQGWAQHALSHFLSYSL